MLKKYLKPAWRNLFHNKVYASINIAGFALGIAACLLIGLSVYHEQSFDWAIPERAQVYRLNEYMHYPGAAPQIAADIAPPIASFLKTAHSEIQRYARVLPSSWIYPSLTLEYGDKKIKSNKLICTDTGFATIFGVDIKEGKRDEFIRNQHSIVLTQSLARKLFGEGSAAGKILTLRVNDTTTYPMAVSNVIADVPGTLHLQYEGLLPISNDFENSYLGKNWGVLACPTYLKLLPHADIANLDKKFTTTIHAKNTGIDMRLQPVADVHAGSVDMNYETFNYKKINGKYIGVFIIIALAIFVMACFNFINLTIAIAAYRGKEIAVRKIMGAGRMRIVLQVLAEAFISVLIALALAVLLTALLLPALNTLLDRSLAPASLYTLPAIGIYLAVLLVTTLLAGFYPALLISSSKILQSLRTKVLFSGSRTSLRNILVTSQFAIAVVFVISLLVFSQQLRFMQEKDLGYSTAQVIHVPLDEPKAWQLDLYRPELLKIKGVTDITNGYLDMGGQGTRFGVDYTDSAGKKQHASFNFENAGPGYVSFFDMKVLQGRDFNRGTDGTEYLINETLARQLGHKDPIGTPINMASFPPGAIVGVVKDFNFASLHGKVEPLVIGYFPKAGWWKHQLYIKVSTANVIATVGEIGTVLKKLSGDPDVDVQFLDERFRQVYRSERQAATLIAVIGSLAVTIACLGLLSLAAFIIVKRAKEIGIHKVLGASVISIVRRLSVEFIWLVVIGFALASPVAWWLTHSWLQDFAYRVDVGWWLFALTGLFAVGIALLTVSAVALKAARANPVRSLRSE